MGNPEPVPVSPSPLSAAFLSAVYINPAPRPDTEQPKTRPGTNQRNFRNLFMPRCSSEGKKKKLTISGHHLRWLIGHVSKIALATLVKFCNHEGPRQPETRKKNKRDPVRGGSREKKQGWGEKNKEDGE